MDSKPLTANQRFYAANREREKARAQEWRDANRERSKATTAAWRAANKERHAAMQKAWFEAHKEERKTYRKEMYAKNHLRENELSREYKIRNRAEIAQKAAEYLLKHPESNRFARSLRRAVEKLAMPVWADRKKIREFYKTAVTTAVETGIPHHVDHIVPLQSKWVCGLHVQNNLQVLPGTENATKSNRRWPDMPDHLRK